MLPLRLISVSDIHGDPGARAFLERIIGRARPDLLVISGDLTTFGPASFADGLLSNLGVRCAAVPGNCDTDEVLDVIQRRCISLHGRRVEIDGTVLVGLGGSPTASNRTPLELPDEEIRGLLEETLIEGCVLVSHTPPLGINDLTLSGRRLGSAIIAELVERRPPALVLSGHVHEARGIVQRGKTIFANPGPLMRGYVVSAEIADGVDAELVDMSDLAHP